jgi:hypothetical protein
LRPNSFMRCFTVSLTILLLFFNCSGPFLKDHPLPDMKPRQLIEKLQSHGRKLRTLQGSAHLTINSESGNFQGTLQIKARLPDSLFIKVEGPFGVDVAYLRLCGQELLFYNPMMKLAYTGSLDEKIDLMPVQINTGDFLLQTLGLLLIPESRIGDIRSLISRSGHYEIYFNNGERVSVLPKGPVVSRWEKRNTNGNLDWTWEGNNFRKSAGVQLPRLIRVHVEHPKQFITVYYTKRKTNKHLKPGWSDLKLPEGVNPIAL